VFRLLSLLPSGRHHEASLPDLQRPAQYYHKAHHGGSDESDRPMRKGREKIVKKVQSSHHLLTSADRDLMFAMLKILL
jgi:hypothetical protein